MGRLHMPAEPRVIVIGGGVAGLETALHLAPLPVTVLSKSSLGVEAATPWAQGGIAAALAPDDEAALHAADTLAAGAGLSDSVIAARVTAAAPSCIEDLCARGVAFDRDAAGALLLGLEAAHSRRRIVHAGGDATGRAVIDGLIRAAHASPDIEILEDVRATDLVVENGSVVGVRALRGEARVVLPARALVLATGGAGGLYLHTTNPLGATGSGIALAARAGAIVRDVEFVQFHPTAIAAGSASEDSSGSEPLPLATEALRGEGAALVNGRGERFMAGIAGGELAPRDIVARAVWREIEAGESVYLDAREAVGARFPERFPSVTALCRKAGLDPARQPIPVRPAAHYHMGGVAVDERGRTSVAGLWACGEVAATGLHGANRLASNSLLEALAFARWIAADIAGLGPGRRTNPIEASGAAAPNAGDLKCAAEIRRLMTGAVGVIRHGPGLEAAIVRLDEIAHARPQGSRAADMALTGLLIAVAARARQESRGAHFRSDHPAVSQAWSRAIELTLADAQEHAAVLRAEYPIARGA